MEKQNSQLEWGQPMEQTRGLLGVARCQSQDQYITSGELIRCLKHIARVSELGSCQSKLCHS